MKIQLFVVEYGHPHIYPPYGAMYIAAALRVAGHEVRIEVSPNWDNIELDEMASRIESYGPGLVGISATICLGYRYVKEASRFLKTRFPGLKIVVGGGLTSAGHVLLEHTAVDVAVIGEGEATVVELIAQIEGGEPLDEVHGIIFRRGSEIVATPKRSPIRRLSGLPAPAFDLVPMEKYLRSIHDVLRDFPSYRRWDPRFLEPHRNTRMLRVPTARGCISKCSFCYRHMKGIRHFDLDEMFDYVEELMARYYTNQFSFGDECFSSSKRWTRRFVEKLEARNLDIMFQILGMRVDTVDRDLLFDLHRLGCWMIEYGFESGSPKMLRVMDKGVTVEDNVNAAVWTREAGIFTSPTFVLGMPGETDDTVRESAEFLRRIGYDYMQYTYAMPVPGTPLYEYALLRGLITDEDRYLESISGVTPNDFIQSDAFVNFTGLDRFTMLRWPRMLEAAMRQNSGPADYYRLKVKNAVKYMKREGVFGFAAGFAGRKLARMRLRAAERWRRRRSPAGDGLRCDILPEGEALHRVNAAIRATGTADGGLAPDTPGSRTGTGG